MEFIVLAEDVHALVDLGSVRGASLCYIHVMRGDYEAGPPQIMRQLVRCRPATL